jgi:hypothetical protein
VEDIVSETGNCFSAVLAYREGIVPGRLWEVPPSLIPRPPDIGITVLDHHSSRASNPYHCGRRGRINDIEISPCLWIYHY